jgi:hypothetical protein
MRSSLFLATALCLLFVLLPDRPAGAAEALATIDGETVSYAEFERLVYTESRQTFYHRAPPGEEEFIAFRRKVANKLIDRKLKIREARERGFEADTIAVDARLAAYEEQYGETERWQIEGEAMIASVRTHFEDESLLEQVEAVLRFVPEPGEDDLEKYYADNIDKFTQPEQLRLSVIVLQVPPWSDQAAWDAANTKAVAIAERISAGGSFAEEARLHSDDATAADGGDMGYLHDGTLSAAVQESVKNLEPGQMVPEPVRVLEGMVLARLEDRRLAIVRPLDAVHEQVATLYRRDGSDAAYEAHMTRLRDASDIQIDDEYLGKTPE